VGRKSRRHDFPNDGGSQIFTPAKLQNRGVAAALALLAGEQLAHYADQTTSEGHP
jgi:hypothetical protein